MSIAAYEIDGDIVCTRCLELYKAQEPSAKEHEVVPVFEAELLPQDRCLICKAWLLEDSSI